jgi:hypothetical protein
VFQYFLSSIVLRWKRNLANFVLSIPKIMRFRTVLLLFAVAAAHASAQTITLNLTNGITYSDPLGAYEPNTSDSPTDADPWRVLIGTIALTSGSANVTLTFAGSIAKFDTVPSSQTNNTCKSNGASSITIPVTTAPTQLYGCFAGLNSNWKGTKQFLITATAPGFVTVTGVLTITLSPNGNLTVSPKSANLNQQSPQPFALTALNDNDVNPAPEYPWSSNPFSAPAWLVINSNNCSATVSTCAISYRVDPTVTITPPVTQTVQVEFYATDGSLAEVNITYTPPAPASVSVQPAALSFQPQLTGLTGPPQTVTLTNTGSSSVSVNGITITGADPTDFVQTNNCPASLAANASCTISVSSMPVATGLRSATLSISDTAAGSPQTVALNGGGVSGANAFAVYRPSNGSWYALKTNATSQYPVPSVLQQWGIPGDIPVPGDYDGDGFTDFAVWRPSNGTWYVLYRSATSSYPAPSGAQQWGLNGDIPVPADYDGDGKTDFAVYRPSNGTWYIIPSSNPQTPIIQQWGLPGDTPVLGDFNNDGKADFAVYRPSSGIWYVLYSNATAQYPVPSIAQQWGLPGDVPISGDFNNDGRTDFAVWRPSNGVWYVLYSSATGQYPVASLAQQWGLPGDTPIVGDFNADGRIDFNVWRSASGVWFSLYSTATGQYPAASAVQQWGLSSDTPIIFR